MKAIKLVLSFIIIFTTVACGKESHKPLVKRVLSTKTTPIAKKVPTLLENLLDNTFKTTIENKNGYFNFYYLIGDNNILYSKHGSYGPNLILADIKTGKQIWSKAYFEKEGISFSYNNYLFGSKIIDLKTGNTSFLCEDEINVQCNKDNTEVIDETSILLFDNPRGIIYRIDFVKGKIIWKINVDNDIQRYYNIVNKIYSNNSINVYAFDERYGGKPDASADLVYHYKKALRGLIAIDINKGQVVYANRCYDSMINGENLIYTNEKNITCIDLLKFQKIWSIESSKSMEYGIALFYKTNLITTTDKGIASINLISGKINWIYEIGNTDYFIGDQKVNNNLIDFELDCYKYLINCDGREFINYHYFYNCKLNLDNGLQIDKQLIKDDTGKNFIVGSSRKIFGDITFDIKQQLSKTNPKKSNTIITFSNSKIKTSFESNDYQELNISPLETYSMNNIEVAYRYYEYETINNIKYIDGKFIVESSKCVAYTFEKGKEIKDIDIPDCDQFVYKKYSMGDYELEIRYGLISKIKNGKYIWQSKIENLNYEAIPYFDGNIIYLLNYDGLYIIDAKSGKFERLVNIITLKDINIAEHPTGTQYLINDEENKLTILKLLKSAVQLIVVDQVNAI
jgi:hypothetical protein